LIQFPIRTLTAFRKLDPEIKRKLVESVYRCHKDQNFESDKAESAPLIEYVEARKPFLPPQDFASRNLFDSWLKMEEASHDHESKAKALRLLRYDHFRQLSGEIAPVLRLAVRHAIEDDDSAFFKKLGRLLEKRAIVFDRPKEPTPVENLLLEHWICQKEKAVHLCCFTDQAIDDFLRAVEVGQTFDSVRKTRYRLRLQRLSSTFPFIKRVKRAGDTIILR